MISKDPDLRLIKQISIYLLESFMKIVNPLLATAFIELHTSKCMITNKFVARSLWPVNGISVTSLFGGKLQVSDDSKSNDFKIHHNGIFHAGFSYVTKCSATLVWHSFSLATFSVSVMDVSYFYQYS